MAQIFLFLVFLTLSSCQFFISAPPLREVGPFLSQEVMQARKDSIRDVHYDLKFDLTAKANFSGLSRILFQLEAPSSLTVDFSQGEVQQLRVNNEIVSKIEYNGYFLVLPKTLLKKGFNKVEIEFSQNYSKNGTGLYRYEDSQDGKVYLYSHFEPYWANAMFPCFDQPNLKATYTTEVKAPAPWQVVTANREIETFVDGAFKVWSFPQTKLFSTYAYSLHAGDYQVWEDSVAVKGSSIPLRLFARQSMAKYVDPNEWFELTKKGFDFFTGYFSYPYIYEKYDQLIVPDFNSGAMENVGAVTFSEDRFVSRGPKTRDQQRRLALTLMHELAHMWFGNLVTMNWWDDLWLNESFASHASYLAVAKVTEFKEAWMVFNTNMKMPAYQLDLSVNTHPVVSEIKSTAEAGSNFDMITYGKGASLLKQLSYFLGENTYQKALGLYFKKFANQNTKLSDFMTLMSETSGKDLSQWEERWLQIERLNDIEVHFVCKNNKINIFEIYQTGTQEYPMLRSHKTRVALFYKERDGFRLWKAEDITFSGEQTEIKKFIGQACPSIVYPNYDDQGYVRVFLDKVSLNNIEKNLVSLNDPFTRGLIWSDLWQMVMDRKVDLDHYLEIAEFNGLNEDHPHNLMRILSDVNSILKSYYPHSHLTSQNKRMVWVQFFEQSYLSRVQKYFDDPATQNIWFESLVNLAESQPILDKLANLLEGRERLFLSFPLDQDQRWSILAQLMKQGHSKAQALLAKEVARDRSKRGELNNLYLSALNPLAENKRKYYSDLLDKQQQLSLAEKKSIMAGLFPKEQESLHRQFADDFFSSLETLYKTAEPIFSTNFANYLVPIFCDQKSANRIDGFIRAEKDELPFGLLKSLRQALFENNRCMEMRAKVEAKLQNSQ